MKELGALLLGDLITPDFEHEGKQKDGQDESLEHGYLDTMGFQEWTC